MLSKLVNILNLNLNSKNISSGYQFISSWIKLSIAPLTKEEKFNLLLEFDNLGFRLKNTGYKEGFFEEIITEILCTSVEKLLEEACVVPKYAGLNGNKVVNVNNLLKLPLKIKFQVEKMQNMALCKELIIARRNRVTYGITES